MFEVIASISCRMWLETITLRPARPHSRMSRMVLRRATGSLRIGGNDVTLGDPTAVRACSVLRTYQTPQTFMQLSCIENVLLTTTDRRYTGILSSVLLRPLMLRHRHALACG